MGSGTRAVLVLLLTLPAIASGDDASKPASPAEEFQALEKAFRLAGEDFNKAYRAATTDEERQKVSQRLGTRASPSNHTEGFLRLVQKYPNDPVALKAFGWLLTYDRYGLDTGKAAASIGPELLASEQIASVGRAMRHYACPAGEKLLRNVLEKNSHRAVQGFARFGLAMCLKAEAERHSRRPDHAGALNREAEQLLEQVVQKYADLPLDSTTLGKVAKPELFELAHLSIGKVAPDIEGEDTDGKPLKLSDYRGKVVLLVFWGAW